MATGGSARDMSLRDYFASQVLGHLVVLFTTQKLAPREDGARVTEDLVAVQAYHFADAMLKARKQR